MKSTLLSRLRTNGAAYIFSALLLIVLSPLYQLLVLAPQGYNEALTASTSGHFAVYIQWLHIHLIPFLLYRFLLILALVLVLSLPFSLFRIIVAQELMAQQEREEQAAREAEEEDSDEDEALDEDEGEEHQQTDEEEEDEVPENTADGMPAYPWRGKGFVVLAAWTGMLGLVIYLLGSIASTLFFISVNVLPPATISFWSALFSITTNTVGVGFLALSSLFFGAVIARAGLNLWPGIWVAFGYAALAVAALFSGSAISVANAPTAGQGVLTGPAIFLFALWILWLGIMLVRLKPEP